MKKLKWILFIARRYVKTNRKIKGPSEASFLLSVAGIASGVLVLTVILAVMNGFQLGFIESILEISSYHVRVELNEIEGAPQIEGASYKENILNNAKDIIKNYRFIKSAVPFAETRGIISGKYSHNQQGIVLRGLSQDAQSNDQSFMKQLSFEKGNFNLNEEDSILLGAEIAARLGVSLGDKINFLSLTGVLPGVIQNENDGTLDDVFTVRGIFRSGYYEYDLGWGFINLERAKKLDENLNIILGIKLNDRYAYRYAENIIQKSLLENFQETAIQNAFLITTWRDYNKAFFGALRTEKLFMFILVGLIFIVVGIQIFQSQRRAVFERQDEIALLKSLGASALDVRLLFTLNGLLIGGIGALLGTVVAVLLASNISAFFTLLENIVNLFARLVSGHGSFAIFSPAIFYIKDIPSRLIPHEVALIFLFGFASACLAGFFASQKTARINPAEVLRYE